MRRALKHSYPLTVVVRVSLLFRSCFLQMSLQEEAEAIRAFIVQIMREPANAPGDVMGRLYAAFPGREELVRQVVNAFLARYARHANGSMLLVARPWRGIHSHIVINVPAICAFVWAATGSICPPSLASSTPAPWCPLLRVPSMILHSYASWPAPTL